MVSSAPNSPGGAAARSRQDTGANLLQELEALSQALYKASQAQNVGSVAGPTPRKDLGGGLLQRRESIPSRGMNDVFSKNPPLLGGNPSQGGSRRPPQVRHSISARPSAPLYEEHEQEELWKQPRHARHSIATPRPHAPVYEHEEEAPQQRFERKLQPWHSQGFEKNLPEVTNFPEWLEDNINFSKKLEAPAEKKKSIWNWKPFRTLSHIGHTRYNCLFTVHVHAIEGLPQAMNGLRLTVHWRHKDRAVQTMPSRVFQGSAEFEEPLYLRCSVYGSKSAHHAVKFMPKAFTLCVIALDVDELMLGEHRLDLSRLLPEAPDHEHEDEDKPLSWTTSFKLSGKAKGGSLVVTFGYELLQKERGDKSGRFGSVIGSPSPSMSSPSMRSFSGGSHSTHGTPRPRHADGSNFLSPTLSEPGDYHDYMGMEHLNLDESTASDNHSPYSSGSFVDNSRGSRGQHRSEQHKVKAFPRGDSKLKGFGLSKRAESAPAPPTPKQLGEPAEPTKKESPLGLSARESYGDSDDDEQEFIVVDQGVEVSSLPGNIRRYAEASSNVGNLKRESAKTPDHLYRDTFSLDHPSPSVQATVARPAEKEAKVASPEFRNVEEISATVVASIKQDQAEPGGHEDEENRLEDAAEEIKVWDPLGRLQRFRQEKQRQEAVLETKAVGRLYIHDEVIVHPKLWHPPESHQEPSSVISQEEEAAPETVLWETTPSSSPLAADEEIRDPVQEEEMWRSLITSESQPSTTGTSNKEKHATVDDLDDEVDLIAGDFLSMLEGSERGGILGMSSDSENDSPRALLLRQFEQEALLEGGIGLRLGAPEMPELNLDEIAEGGRIDGSGHSADNSDGYTPGWQSEEDTELASIMEAAESELQKATQTMRSKTRAKMLEDAETEALMQEWGLNERAFENSPPKPAQGFLDIMGNQMVKVPTEPPVLAQGVGPVLQTKDGGMLRSMTPGLFSQNNACGKLVMQVSKPVVVPSEMGSSGLDIFRRLASGGVENMALQAMVAMPLEDITGKSVHQLAYETKAALEGPSQNYLPSNGYNTALSVSDTGRHRTHDLSKSKSSAARRSSSTDPSDEFVSLEELAPMAMQKIESLAMDGLKIQADMTDETAPYSVDSLPWADAALQEGSKFRKGGGIGSLDGVAAMHLLDSRNFGEDVHAEADGLMSKVISIDEWMRLDAGQYDENDTKGDTLAILAAHGAVHKDVVTRGSKEDRIRYLQGAKASANFGKGGFMGNTLTIAMLVQLRDPLRNNEPVGAPMMALVQAERVIVPPRPKIPRRTPSMLGNSEVWADEEEIPPKPEELQQPQFKITAVHMSGLKPSEEQSKEQSNKKKVWGNQKQQQSGSRWLAANGMGKSPAAGSKLSALKNKPQPAKTTVKPGESLWSISARVHGTGSKWKEVAALNPHIRNPDVIFANQNIRTR